VRSFSGAWRVVAEADDGIMEAIEHKQHPWMISVLWHPEVSLEDQVNQNIFKAQVEAAKR
jgi:putative glutamine amidotransferase